MRRKGERTLEKKSGGVEEELLLDVGGLITPTQEHVQWLNHKLKIGDEVRIQVVKDADIDQPRRRKRIDHAKDLRVEALRQGNGERNSDGNY